MAITVTGVSGKINVLTKTTTSEPEAVLSGGDIEVTAVTANIFVVAGEAAATEGAFEPGDARASPTSISGSGTITWAVTNYTIELDEIEGELGFATYNTRWLKYTSTGGNLIIDIDSTGGGGDFTYVEAWDATANPADSSLWTYLDGDGDGGWVGSDGTMDLGYWPDGSVIVLRAGTAEDADTFNITIDYTLTEPDDETEDGGQVGDLIVELKTLTVYDTPSSIEFSLYNADAEENIDVELAGNVLGTYLSDLSGVILNTTVPIPALNEGTYTLSFTGGGETTSNTFQVLEDSMTAVSPPTADATPTVPGAPHRWIFQDAAGVLPDFEFTYNPTTMASPYAVRSYTMDVTTSPEGQALIWEGSPRTVDWDFAGYLDTEADLEAFEAYANLNRRFYCIDHRDRAWIISITAFDPQPKRVFGTPYAHQYTVKALLYGEGEV